MEVIKNIGIKKLIIILLCGVVLMFLTFSEINIDDKNKKDVLKDEKLEKMLKSIDGVEDVEVMITYNNKGEAKGALVVVKEIRNPNVINEIADTIQVLFDIPVHKIKVMKMK